MTLRHGALTKPTRTVLVLAFACLWASMLCPVAAHAMTPQAAGWQWQNPLPQGNPLRAVDMVDAATGWAVGEAGAVLKTTDGGQTWTDQTSNLGYILQSVDFVDTNTGWAVGYDVIVKTSDGGATWTRQNGGTDCALQDVEFVNAATGWAVGARGDEGVVLKTTDGGQSWIVSTPIANKAEGEDSGFFSVSLIDANRGWLVGRFASEDGEGVDRTIVLKTTNAGASWTPATTSGLPTHFGSIDFVDANTGWTTNYESVFKTSDGGATWTVAYTSSDGRLGAAFFLDPQRAWVVHAGESILHTANGGSSWSVQPTGVSAADDAIRALSFANADVGCAVGRGILLATANGGSVWDSSLKGTTNMLRSVSFVDAGTGWVVGDAGTIVKTADGSTWGAQASGTDSALNGVDFVDENHGWAVGDHVILRTTDGGLTWESQWSTHTLNAVDFADSQTGWAVGEFGIVLRTDDGGATWHGLRAPTLSDLRTVVWSGSGTVWVAGDNGEVYRSDSSGSWWTDRSPRKSPYERCYDADFVDSTTGWVVGGTTFKTTDGGKSWTAQPSDAGWLFAVDFVDANTGWAVGDSGTVVKTTDGGATWNRTVSVTSNGLLAVHFLDSQTGWVLGSNGTILKTVNGGLTLSLKPSNLTPRYGEDVSLTATFGSSASDGAFTNATVVFDRYKTGEWGWVEVGSAVTDSNGKAVLSVKPYGAAKTVYRARVGRDVGPELRTAEAVSGPVEVTPHVYLTKGNAPKTMYKRSARTVTGYLKPRHTRGSKLVAIRLYKKNSKGVYVYQRHVHATTANYSSYSKYTRSLTFPSAGKWRIRSYMPADSKHAATYSSYDYVTVK